MTDGSRRRVSLALLGGSVLLALAVLRRCLDRVSDVPLSPLTAGRIVGADYVERRDIGDGTHPVGEMDDLDAYARPDFDPARVHPDVRRFYEHTSAFDLAYSVRWHRGFRVGATLASLLTSRLQQLNLPGRSGAKARRLDNRIVGIDDDADPRTGARAWVRTDPNTGDAVFVAVYASHQRDGETYTNIAVPLPRSNLSTVLRMDHLGDGVELSTEGAGDGGLYLATPLGSFRLPMAQRFRVWPADAPGAPDDITHGKASVVATHEMWVFGRQFLTITYAGREKKR